MTLPHWALHLPQIYYSILLAALILVNSIISIIHGIVSYVQKKRIEAREVTRQDEIANNLELSQELVKEHSILLRREIDDVKREIRENTAVNVEALEKANGFNEKIAAVAELAAALPTIQQVEIVQPADNPIPVHEVDGGLK